jgi:pyruvate dehydrogenase E2 component (dihydrolipoyllysine-residue acetyltransferase)
MAIEITVPRLGWSMEEGTLAKWLKRDGEFVRKRDMLFVLEGDKAAQEIESFDEGILRLAPSGPKPGDVVRVGQVLAYLVAKDEVPPFGTSSVTTARSEPAIESGPKPPPPAGPAARRMARQLGVDLTLVAASGPGGRVLADDIQSVVSRSTLSSTTPRTFTVATTSVAKASPRARRVAAELSVDWTALSGSGRNGRVRERDVLAAVQTGDRAVMSTREHRPSTIVGIPAATETRSQLTGRVVPMSATRRLIAQRMVAAARETVPVTLTTTADATNLVQLRNQFKAASSHDALAPSYTDWLVKLAALALVQHPMLNAQWRDDGLFLPDEINIGIAVDTDDGLLVPVVRNVSTLPLRQLTASTHQLIELAKNRRLAAENMQGGTFTVTNLGSLGVEAFTPIIVPPQCAILGVGRISLEPAVVDDRFVPRHRIWLSLSFDHRIVDGAPAARFLETIKQFVENPAPQLVG